jgi:uncharacterized protein Yka (UPF0111/DUF47 family)
MSRRSKSVPQALQLKSDRDLALMLIGEQSAIIDRLEAIANQLELLGVSTPLAEVYSQRFKTAKKARKLAKTASCAKTDPRQLHLFVLQD